MVSIKKKNIDHIGVRRRAKIRRIKLRRRRFKPIIRINPKGHTPYPPVTF